MATGNFFGGQFFGGGFFGVVTTTTTTEGAGSGGYRRKRFEDEYEVLLYLEGLRNEFRAVKAEAVHIAEVSEGERGAEPPPAVESGIAAIQADFDAYDELEALQHETAARLAILDRLITKIEALEARIREEEEMLLL